MYEYIKNQINGENGCGLSMISKQYEVYATELTMEMSIQYEMYSSELPMRL